MMQQGIVDSTTSIITAAMTPELVAAVVITLAATHQIKVLAEHWTPQVTETAPQWRVFCTLTSISVGALTGLITWAATDASWATIPLVALGSGPMWRLLQVFVPPRFCSAFLTSTDRRHRKNGHAR